MSKTEIEQFVLKLMESRLQQVVEEYISRNDGRIKELALVERVVRVEEELKSLREMSELRFDASEKRFDVLQKTMNERFEALLREMNARFEALQREMDARFKAVDKRFESVDKRFDAMDKRFTTLQWMIGVVVGIPALVIAIAQVIQLLK
ncbi:MAG: hypothetical protein GTN53_32710 [Candidatus Aminicenantes bacterium]|nr:hypothetical protein [Candidatus Aminicenantes bacterium]NIN22240.1 hypothetical protein [Candidatus Aminicenantes bacterium]NIO85315.1 hypothetical protein [Candidatus Aminicenantes bacterium]NIQ71213.1 hypothetical protein [Candidatus Aminicenantes bacterium]NIT27274.1 hypothetical protein [Candidatus Aminicenantes bacterium]